MSTAARRRKAGPPHRLEGFDEACSRGERAGHRDRCGGRQSHREQPALAVPAPDRRLDGGAGLGRSAMIRREFAFRLGCLLEANLAPWSRLVAAPFPGPGTLKLISGASAGSAADL